jgi:hypothetical protein
VLLESHSKFLWAVPEACVVQSRQQGCSYVLPRRGQAPKERQVAVYIMYVTRRRVPKGTELMRCYSCDLHKSQDSQEEEDSMDEQLSSIPASSTSQADKAVANRDSASTKP